MASERHGVSNHLRESATRAATVVTNVVCACYILVSLGSKIFLTSNNYGHLIIQTNRNIFLVELTFHTFMKGADGVTNSKMLKPPRVLSRGTLPAMPTKTNLVSGNNQIKTSSKKDIPGTISLGILLHL